jgi:hypothetical protein
MGRHRKRVAVVTPGRYLLVVLFGLAGYLGALTGAGVIRWTS